MADTRLKYLYIKYLDGSCTGNELHELWELVAAQSNDDELEQLSDEYWDSHEVSADLPVEKADKIFISILSEGGLTTQTKPRIFIWKTYKWAIAASLLLITSLAFYFYKSAPKQQSAVLAQAKASREHQLIKLPDGSTVVLNSNSYLEYPVAFNSGKREVTLRGEGYFDIKHDIDHPFIVHTGKIITTVLGTAFNINAYDNQKLITVTVTRGKVSVSDEKKVLAVITPDQQLVFNKDQERSVRVAVNSTQAVEWQSKDLFFDDTNMEQAALQLEQKFKVKIEFANDAVRKCRFTGTFLHGEKLKDILDVICQFNNATYKISGNGEITIDGAGC